MKFVDQEFFLENFPHQKKLLTREQMSFIDTSKHNLCSRNILKIIQYVFYVSCNNQKVKK